MKYAVVRISGHQYRVTEGDKLKVDRLKDKTTETLLFVDGTKVEIGSPVLKGVGVDLQVLEEKKDKKIEVIRFKAKSRYRRKRGHRQPITILQVKALGRGKGKIAAKAKTKPTKS